MIEETSKSLQGDRDQVDTIMGRTNGTDLAWPGYGLYLMKLNGKHTDARTEQAKVLKVAKEVLESWETTFVTSDRKYTKSDDDQPPIDNLGGNLPNITPPDLGGLNSRTPNLTNPNFTDPNFTNPNLTNPDLTNPNLTNPNLTNPNLTNPNLTNPNLTNPNLTNPNLTNPNLTNPNLTNPDLTNPNLTNPNLANPNIPDPTKTDLSGYDPSAAQIQQARFPEGAPTMDPGRVTTGSPGTGTSTGMGTGGMGAGGQVPGLAKGANGLGGMGGMPFMPMAPMGAGGDREKEGSASDLLRGDEGDWGADEDVAPAVLQHEDT
ncbi:pentapeptide repeat-containing protein [Nonomuraea sp. NPDC048916]|uniref:pentapeptide repeat-containing protein n=1 Tax=Nonomuraea sp. NPDC048916 TaxID=3154232 RepID=UPI0033DA5ADB